MAPWVDRELADFLETSIAALLQNKFCFFGEQEWVMPSLIHFSITSGNVPIYHQILISSIAITS